MADLDALVPSNSTFLAKDDVGTDGVNLTIERIELGTVGQGSEQETKALIYFKEQDYKPMVLNKTNKERLKYFLHVTDSDECAGKTVNVYNDPTVEYGGKMTGGLRIRGPQGQQEPTF